MKKKIIAATMAAAMCVSLAACGGSTASSSAAESTASSIAESTASSTADAASTGDEEVDLRMAWWGSQDRHDRTIKAIELYESLHPNVKIEYEYYSFDDYFTKLKTLVASDQVWDIFQLGGNFPMYMDKIYPLDDYIASGVVDVSGIGDANLKTTQDTEGHQLGISNGLNSYGIAYDADMFAEAGVAEPTDTWTWDDYANAANTIHEKLGIYGCSSMLTSEFIAGCSVYVAQYGDVGQYSFFNLDLTGMGFDDPQMLTPYIQMRADSIKNEVYPDAGASAEIDHQHRKRLLGNRRSCNGLGGCQPVPDHVQRLPGAGPHPQAGNSAPHHQRWPFRCCHPVLSDALRLSGQPAERRSC